MNRIQHTPPPFHFPEQRESLASNVDSMSRITCYKAGRPLSDTRYKDTSDIAFGVHELCRNADNKSADDIELAALSIAAAVLRMPEQIRKEQKQRRLDAFLNMFKPNASKGCCGGNVDDPDGHTPEP